MKYIVIVLCFFYVNSTTVNGVYENVVNQDIDYSQLDDDNKMIGFLWEDFKVKTGEKIKKVMFFLSTTKTFLGEWQGAFGTSTTKAPEHWYMTDSISKPFTKKTGRITWEIIDTISEIIDQNGELKFGVWYIDCNDFTIDKIVVFTDAYEGGYDDEEEDEEETDKNKAVKIAEGTYKAEIGEYYIFKELGDNKMLPINWDLFSIPKNETITKIKIILSTTEEELGKWVGAFGSATGVAPDYWLMTKDLSKFLKGSNNYVIWKLTVEEAEAVQSQSKGQLKLGVWSIDCNTFTIESCTIYTNAASEEEEKEKEKEKEIEKEEKGEEKEKENKNNDKKKLTPAKKFGIAFLIILVIFLLLFVLFMIIRYIRLRSPNGIE